MRYRLHSSGPLRSIFSSAALNSNPTGASIGLNSTSNSTSDSVERRGQTPRVRLLQQLISVMNQYELGKTYHPQPHPKSATAQLSRARSAPLGRHGLRSFIQETDWGVDRYTILASNRTFVPQVSPTCISACCVFCNRVVSGREPGDILTFGFTDGASQDVLAPAQLEVGARMVSIEAGDNICITTALAAR